MYLYAAREHRERRSIFADITLFNVARSKRKGLSLWPFFDLFRVTLGFATWRVFLRSDDGLVARQCVPHVEWCTCRHIRLPRDTTRDFRLCKLLRRSTCSTTSLPNRRMSLHIQDPAFYYSELRNCLTTTLLRDLLPIPPSCIQRSSVCLNESATNMSACPT